MVADASIILTATVVETTLLAAQGVGVFADLASIHLQNSGVATVVTIRSSLAGSQVYTIQMPTLSNYNLQLPVPRKQATANSAWTAQCSIASTSVTIGAVFVLNS
jgi:hypothetical protein